MARITVEDCLENIDNRFSLVLMGSRRARQLSHGAEPLLEAEGDKPTVLALREIAAGLITAELMDSIDDMRRMRAEEKAAEAQLQQQEE